MVVLCHCIFQQHSLNISSHFHTLPAPSSLPSILHLPSISDFSFPGSDLLFFFPHAPCLFCSSQPLLYEALSLSFHFFNDSFAIFLRGLPVYLDESYFSLHQSLALLSRSVQLLCLPHALQTRQRLPPPRICCLSLAHISICYRKKVLYMSGKSYRMFCCRYCGSGQVRTVFSHLQRVQRGKDLT